MHRSTIVVSFLIALAFVSCSEQAEEFAFPGPPQIVLEGKKIDTAYMFTAYKDPGASYYEERDGVKNCNEYGIVTEVTGSVNTNVPGIYYLTYNATDNAGIAMSPVTRTIVVVENSTNFLNGFYTVACTCTAMAAKENPTITSQNYTAVVNPSPRKDHFELISLEVGGEKIVSDTYLRDGIIELEYGLGSANFDWTNSRGTGTLSAGKNSFTIETQAQRFTPAIKYLCKNVYTKFLTIKNADPESKR